jgi:lipoprotein signal peptidase
MISKTRYIIFSLIGGFFFIVDQNIKWWTLHSSTQPKIFFNLFGWYPFHNPGIAFGIPIPSFIVMALTLPVLAGLLFVLIKQGRLVFLKQNITSSSSDFFTWLSALLVFTGALSNFIDRILYNFTIDYFLVFTGIINLADVLIVSGFVLYFFRALKNRKVINNSLGIKD